MTTILLLLAPTLLHLALDSYRLKKSKIVHWQSALLVVITALVAAYVHSNILSEFLQFLTFSLSIHFSCFDPIWNWIHGHHWNYHGDLLYYLKTKAKQALTDTIWQMLPWWVELFFRLLALGTGLSVYFMDEWGLII